MANEVTRDIGQLASGTIATLTGYRLYVEIDSAREKVRQWSEGKRFETWQDAWNTYIETNGKPRP